MLITSLPTCVSGAVLGEWSAFQALVRLDSACCRRSMRPLLLEIYKSNDLVVNSMITVWTEHIQWLEKRKIKVIHANILLADEDDSDLITRYVQTVGHHFRTIICDSYGEKIPQSIAQYCHNLTHLTCNVVREDVNVRHLLHSNPHLRELCLHIARSRNTPFLEDMLSGISLPLLEFLSLNFDITLPRASFAAADFSKRLLRLSLTNRGGYVPHTNEAMALLELCPHLRALRLDNVQLQSDQLARLSSLHPDLQHLELVDVKRIDDRTVRDIVRTARHLRSFCAVAINHSNICFTIQSLQYLVEYCGNTLERVCLSSSVIAATAVDAFKQSCPSLHTLHITHMYEYNGFQSPTSITILKLNHSHAETVDRLCTFCPHLEVLDVSKFLYFTDDFAQDVLAKLHMEACPNLHTIWVHMNNHITAECAAVFAAFPHLKFVTDPAEHTFSKYVNSTVPR